MLKVHRERERAVSVLTLVTNRRYYYYCINTRNYSKTMAISAFKVVSCLLFVSLIQNNGIIALRRGQQSNPYMVSRWYSLPGVSETPYSDCKPDGSDGKITKVEVIPCELDGEACILRAGKNATIKVSFDSKVASAKLKAVVHGIVGSVPIPFHIPQADACQKSGISCPLKPSTSYDYSTEIPVLSSYPRMSVKVKWELIDSNNKDVVCIIIPAKIRS